MTNATPNEKETKMALDCPICGGFDATLIDGRKCGTCGGTGKVPPAACPWCGVVTAKTKSMKMFRHNSSREPGAPRCEGSGKAAWMAKGAR